MGIRGGDDKKGGESLFAMWYGSHLIKNCPLLPAIRPRPSTTHIRRVAFQEVEKEDEDDEEEKE
jgi:hypothetical protein